MSSNSTISKFTSGFTLLEVLVAVSIFSIMSIVALTGIKTIIDSQETTNKVAARIKSLQNTFFYFNQDLRYAIARDIRDEFGDTQAAMQAGNAGPQGLALTRIGIGNPKGSKRSSMIRVRYSLSEGKLIRSRYKTLDRAGEAETLDRTLIDNIEELEFRFLDSGNEWQTSWPKTGSATTLNTLPRAVEVNLTHQEIGKINRIIPLAGY